MNPQLPATRLPALDRGEPVDLRSGRGPLVVVVAHDGSCEACRRYATRLSDGAAIRDWGGRVRTVIDPEAKLRIGAPGVIVADEWGEIYFETEGGAEHALPDAEEVTDWVRFIAIQCPECEGPEGEWRTL